MTIRKFKNEAIISIKSMSIELDKSSQLRMIGYNISSDIIFAIFNDIFNEYIKGISDTIIPAWKIYVIKGNISERLDDLKPYLSKEDYLLSCLLIGTKIDDLVIEAVNNELFETAANLNRILYD